VLDRRKGATLLTLTKEKKGAESLRERLEVGALAIVPIAVVIATPDHARADGRLA
jgi:hypothetical protein